MSKELKVISDCYDLAKYLAERVEKFPRSRRHVLGAEIDRRAQGVLLQLVRVKYTPGADAKTRLLDEVNIELEALRFQLRLAAELKALPLKSHGQAWQRVQDVGIQVGGWLRSLRARVGPAASG